MKFATKQEIIYGVLTVRWTDGSTTRYSSTDVGCDWLTLSANEFRQKYGFAFNPHKYPGLLGRCREELEKRQKKTGGMG